MSAITGGLLGGIVGVQMGSSLHLPNQTGVIVMLALLFTSSVAGFVYMKRSKMRGFGFFDFSCGFSVAFVAQGIALFVVGLIWVAVFGG